MSKLIPQEFNNPLLDDITNYTINSYLSTLTQKELEVLNNYSQTYFKIINSNLRCGLTIPEVQLLDSSLDKFHYDKEFTVYRKVFIKDLWVNPYTIDPFIKLLKRGYIIDKAYQSTSLNQISFRAPHNVLFELNIINHNAGAYIGPISSVKEEEEFLLKRRTKIDIDEYFIDRESGLIKVKGSVR